MNTAEHAPRFCHGIGDANLAWPALVAFALVGILAAASSGLSGRL